VGAWRLGGEDKGVKRGTEGRWDFKDEVGPIILGQTNGNFHDSRDVRTCRSKNCRDILDASLRLVTDGPFDQIACIVCGDLAGNEDLTVGFDSLALLRISTLV
jgi:hypothetical protein